MAHIERSELSLRDVLEIARYISRNNTAAASKVLDTIDAKYALLAEHPELGELRPDLGVDVRTFSAGSYVIVYRPISNGIEVVRVIHASRDLDSLF